MTLLFLACLNGVLPGQSTQQSAPNTLSSPTYILLEKVELDKVMEKNAVKCMLHDRRGFLWLGTSHSGLVRYGGYEFKYFQHQPFDSLSLLHNHVNALHEDSRGWLWIGTYGGLACYRP